MPILLVSLLFGAVHTLNVFVTGELGPALVHSIAAGMSGLIFMAIVIRTGSIWPAIIYHFFLGCLIFLVSTGVAFSGQQAVASELGAIAMFTLILLNLPNVIFALGLLRKAGW